MIAQVDKRKTQRRLRWSAVDVIEDNAQLVSAILRIIVFVALLIAARALLRLYFFGGSFFGIEVPDAKIERIEVSAGDAIPPAMLLDHLRMREGMPVLDPREGLFADDLGRRQAKILRAAPALASLSLTRGHSNVLYVASTERAPLARFQSKFDYVIDRDAVVFVRHRGIESLPVVTGLAAQVHPGERITQHRMLTAALELLKCLEDGASELRKGFLVSVDVSKQDYVTCEFTDGRVARLAWKHMGRGDRGRKWLVAQLDGYVAAIQSPRSRGCRYYDLTIPGHCYATQSK